MSASPGLRRSSIRRACCLTCGHGRSASVLAIARAPRAGLAYCQPWTLRHWLCVSSRNCTHGPCASRVLSASTCTGGPRAMRVLSAAARKEAAKKPQRGPERPQRGHAEAPPQRGPKEAPKTPRRCPFGARVHALTRLRACARARASFRARAFARARARSRARSRACSLARSRGRARARMGAHARAHAGVRPCARERVRARPCRVCESDQERWWDGALRTQRQTQARPRHNVPPERRPGHARPLDRATSGGGPKGFADIASFSGDAPVLTDGHRLRAELRPLTSGG